jgi:hypothetical protein
MQDKVLYQLLPVLVRCLNTGNWQTQRIDFDNNGLLLEVDTLSLSDLEQLRQQLTMVKV